MLAKPSVAMMGSTLPRLMTRPTSRPHKVPIAVLTKNMTSVEEYTPSRISRDALIPENARVAETEMSIPPMSSTLIIPSASVMVVE